MRTHLVGIGGIGMSGLAQILLWRGETVSGSDTSQTPLLNRLEKAGARIHRTHDARNVRQADRVVYSSSIPPQNPELIYARNHQIPVVHRGQMLAQLLKARQAIAVTGAHGKSTTASLAAELLIQAGWDPLVILGAEHPGLGGNAREGKGRYAVVEADESDGSFLWLDPAIGIVTNIDEEHLDFYRNRNEIQEAYRLFVKHLRSTGILIGCVDHPEVVQLLRGRAHSIGYGLSAGATIRADGVKLFAGGSRFSCFFRSQALGEIELKIPGIHNVVNALAIVALGQKLKIDFSIVQQALGSFAGARRRFQIQGREGGILVVEDYGHHPAEIETTLQSAREFQAQRIRCVFQPHRYTRTLYLLERFASALLLADEVILLPIYAASEEPLPGVNSGLLLKAIQRRGGRHVRLLKPESVIRELVADSRPGDLILFQGAGNVGSLASQMVSGLKK